MNQEDLHKDSKMEVSNSGYFSNKNNFSLQKTNQIEQHSNENTQLLSFKYHPDYENSARSLLGKLQKLMIYPGIGHQFFQKSFENVYSYFYTFISQLDLEFSSILELKDQKLNTNNINSNDSNIKNSSSEDIKSLDKLLKNLSNSQDNKNLFDFMANLKIDITQENRLKIQDLYQNQKNIENKIQHLKELIEEKSSNFNIFKTKERLLTETKKSPEQNHGNSNKERWNKSFQSEIEESQLNSKELTKKFSIISDKFQAVERQLTQINEQIYSPSHHNSTNQFIDDQNKTEEIQKEPFNIYRQKSGFKIQKEEEKHSKTNLKINNYFSSKEHTSLLTENKEETKEINHKNVKFDLNLINHNTNSPVMASQNGTFSKNDINILKKEGCQQSLNNFLHSYLICKPYQTAKNDSRTIEEKVQGIQMGQNSIINELSDFRISICDIVAELKKSNILFCKNFENVSPNQKLIQDYYVSLKKICYERSSFCFICSKDFCLEDIVKNCHYCHKQVCLICFSNQEKSELSRFDQCEICHEWCCDNCKIDNNNSNYCYQCLLTDLGIYKISNYVPKTLNHNIKYLNLFDFRLKHFELNQLFNFVKSNGLESINFSLFISNKNIGLFGNFIESLRSNRNLKSFNILFHEGININILVNIIYDNFKFLGKMQKFSFSCSKFIGKYSPGKLEFSPSNIGRWKLNVSQSNEKKHIEGVPLVWETYFFENLDFVQLRN